jgi:hypothetical protein
MAGKPQRRIALLDRRDEPTGRGLLYVIGRPRNQNGDSG